mgnify:CR=1 FL=1
MGMVSTVIGIVALVKVRTENIRWKTIYITSFVILFECVFIVSFLVRITSFVSLWQTFTTPLIFIGLIGLIGVIISLC